MELFIEKARELYKVQQELKVYKAQEEQLKDELKKITNDEGAREGGFHFTYDIRKGAIDYAKLIKVELSDDFNFEPYRKEETKAWKLSLYLEEN
jgi:hypothetical protein